MGGGVDLGHGLTPHQQARPPSSELSGSGDTETGMCPPPRTSPWLPGVVCPQAWKKRPVCTSSMV